MGYSDLCFTVTDDNIGDKYKELLEAVLSYQVIKVIKVIDAFVAQKGRSKRGGGAFDDKRKCSSAVIGNDSIYSIYYILPCKFKMQYLFTLQVSRYCLLALQDCKGQTSLGLAMMT